MKPLERFSQWLEPSVSAAWMAILGRPAPATMFFAFLALYLARRIVAITRREMLSLHPENAPAGSSPSPSGPSPQVLGPVRPAVRSESVQSLLSLTETLLASRAYRGSQWKSDWAEQGLNLCAELDELERQGMLDAHQIDVSHRFIDEYTRLRPQPRAP